MYTLQLYDFIYIIIMVYFSSLHNFVMFISANEIYTTFTKVVARLRLHINMSPFIPLEPRKAIFSGKKSGT